MKKNFLHEAKREDLIDSILMYNEEYADNVGINFIGPTQEDLQNFTDEELEQELKFAKTSYEGSVGYGDTHGESEEDQPALAQEPVYSDEDHTEDNLPTYSGMGRRSGRGFRTNIKRENGHMRLAINHLRKIIRETIEETVEETAMSPEEFESIVTESKIKFRLNEDFGVLTVTLGTVLGILAYKIGKAAAGVAATAAQNLAYNLEQAAQDKLRAKAEAAEKANLDAAVASLADDPQLAKMFNQLIQLQFSGTSKQVSQLSKQITAYVNDNMNQTGADPMDVRIALSKRAGAARSSRW